jgi:hypothetical protein
MKPRQGIPTTILTCVLWCAFSPVSTLAVTPSEEKDEQSPRIDTIYQDILSKNMDMSERDLFSKIDDTFKKRIEKISFDPTKLSHYNYIVSVLPFSEDALTKLKKNGFTTISKHPMESFGTAYYHIYTNDLPLFITTDSILHALHVSYDEILKEMETKIFTPVFADAIHATRNSLLEFNRKHAEKWRTHRDDVDIYLSVAANLLKGAGAEIDINAGKTPSKDVWNGGLLEKTLFGNDSKVLNILSLISKHEMKPNTPTEIYGGKRFLDYSQFIPRGHYTESTALKRYFRLMMWLGRMDCGFNMLSPKSQTELVLNPKRECRDAALLTVLLSENGALENIRDIGRILTFMVGNNDSLSPEVLAKLLKDNKLDIADILSDDKNLAKLQAAVKSSPFARQMIQSQIIYSDPISTAKSNPPAVFQFFGQRFAIDAFILNRVTFDKITFHGNKSCRYQPKGLDVMAALGNDNALELLRKELRRYCYSSNMYALRKTLETRPEPFWRKNAYNIWLDTLRVIGKDLDGKNVPESMRTTAWRMKQLQTQHASWSQLRHDTILYTKQPYCNATLCEYPVCYVEPYPAFFTKLATYADSFAEIFSKTKYQFIKTSSAEKKPKEYSSASMERIQKTQVAYMKNFASVMRRLQGMAEKELAGEPFSEKDESFFRKTIDKHEQSGGPNYNGWYCDIFYCPGWYGGLKRHEKSPGGWLAYRWKPEVADVYSYPDKKSVLETAVGNAEFMVIAIDNENHRDVYVGPVYTYYEFWWQAEKRLNDVKWGDMLLHGHLPQRPEWTKSFVSSPGESVLNSANYPYPLKIDKENFLKYEYLFFSNPYSSSQETEKISKELTKRIREEKIKVEFDSELYSLIEKEAIAQRTIGGLQSMLFLKKSPEAFNVILKILVQGIPLDPQEIASTYYEDSYFEILLEMLRRMFVLTDIRCGHLIEILMEYEDKREALVSTLGELLNSKSDHDRECLMEALDSIGNENAIAAFKKYLKTMKNMKNKDRSPFFDSIHRNVLLILYRHGEKETVEKLEKAALGNGDGISQKDALEIITNAKQEKASDFLIPLLHCKNISEKDAVFWCLRYKTVQLSKLAQPLLKDLKAMGTPSAPLDKKYACDIISILLRKSDKKDEMLKAVFENLPEKATLFENDDLKRLDRCHGSFSVSKEKWKNCADILLNAAKSENVNARRTVALIVNLLFLPRKNRKEILNALPKDEQKLYDAMRFHW